MKSITRASRAVAAAGVALSMLAFATPVLADVDPAACTDNGGGISVAAFRADGITNIGAGTVADNENINYKATLSDLGGSNCAFEGGTWTLTTPDGVAHNLGAVPRIGGTGVASVTSSLVPYTVDHGDEIVNSTRHIDATTAYSGGISHADLLDETNGPSLGASKILKVVHTPSVTTNVHNTSHAVITSAVIGSSVHDNAVVTGEIGGPAPTGTVSFNLYSNVNCEGATTTEAVALSGNTESSPTVVPAAGLSYKAYYNGDSNYNPSLGACEPLTADKLNSTTVTEIHNAAEAVVTSVNAGTTVHDKATVTGSGPTPTGTVDFTFYTNLSCDGQGVAAGTDIALVSGVAHPSSSEGPLAVGSYSFMAHYDGDATYNPSDGACEPLTVIAQGHIIVDKVTNPAADPTSFTFTTTGAGYNGFSLTDVATPDDQTLNAGTYSVAETPISGWVQTSVVCTSSLGGSENPASIGLTAGETVTCVFTNTQVVNYCSPGYWKQEQHFDSWTAPYDPTDAFSSVFSPITIMWSSKGKPGSVANPTLLQALEANGGGINLLARAAVGGLLNAAALNSGYTPAQVIAIVNAAIAAGTDSAYQAAATQLTAPENCPLN